MKLNIYENGRIAKTYEADKADILYGTVEDLISIAEDISMSDINTDTGKMKLGMAILKAIPKLMPVLKDVFTGLTDEEIRKTKVNELVSLFMEIGSQAIDAIAGIGGDNEGN